MKNKKYVYPQVPGHDFFLFRTMGSGLANCLFVYARAIAYAYRSGAKIITPTWFNIGVGPYIRHQKDKRHYLDLFSSQGEIYGINKFFKMLFFRKDIEIITGLGNYFEDILDESELVAQYIESHVNPKLLQIINVFDFSNCVAVHVRLGDYPERIRVPIVWYKQKILDIQKEHPEYRFIIFSDGRDDELVELLSIQNVRREFFGNAMGDILAISRCCFLVGSDSTFSGWGAYLGQVPCVFYRKHYGRVLRNSSKEIVEETINMWIK